MSASVEELIKDEVKAFFGEFMSARPRTISVDVHPDDVVVVLGGAMSDGERACSDKQKICCSIEKYYGDVFEQSKVVFESSLSRVTGRPVVNSFIKVHVQTGSFIVVAMLGSDSSSCGA